MKLDLRKFGPSPLRVRNSHAALIGCLALFPYQSVRAQQAMPPAAPTPPATTATEADKQKPVPLPDPFSLALERLSKKYGIAFVAEGRPFAQSRTQPATAPLTTGTGQEDGASPEESQEATKAASPEEEVRAVADRFDYTAVRQDNVYLLTKRYTNPDEIPEVTPEELRASIDRLSTHGANPHVMIINSQPVEGSRERGARNFVNGRLKELAGLRTRLTQAEFFSMLSSSMEGLINKDSLRDLTDRFYFQSSSDRLYATEMLLEHSRPLDPVFRWQTIGETPVFGYDTQFYEMGAPVFLPASDTDRIQVVPYGTPLPFASYNLRYEMNLPESDPTDPATLSEAAKRFLDDNGRSSRAVTLAEALVALNKRVPDKTDKKIYKVDPIYAGRRVTLVGVDTLAPETFVQALAAVEGFNVDHRRDHTVVLQLGREVSRPDDYTYIRTYWQNYARYNAPKMPEPIYHAVHARFLQSRTKSKNQEGPQLLEYEAQYEFQRIADAYRYAAMRQLRYLVEPQMKTQPKKQLALSRSGERARTLFTFAQTIPALAGYCKLLEIPLPPYITHPDDFRFNVRITVGIYPTGGSPDGPYIRDPVYFSKITYANGVYSAPDDTARMALFVTYVDPKSGETRGPVRILDMSLYAP